MTAAQFANTSEARRHFKELLDAAEDGRAASVRRDNRRLLVVDGERLRNALTKLHTSGAVVVPEGDGVSIFIPGVPVAADGASVAEALSEMVDALREYADDWEDHLRLAPNHADNWGLVQIVQLSDDDQLKDWLTR
jgi:Antitoxin of toxin-antitoxin, RelE / RelB, TA system